MTDCKSCKEKLFQVQTSYFTAGIVVKNKKIIKAAPILKWAIGKTLSQFEVWAKTKKGYKLSRCEDVKVRKELEN